MTNRLLNTMTFMICGLIPSGNLLAADTVNLTLLGDQSTVTRLSKLTSIKKDAFEKTADFGKRLCQQTLKELGVTEKTPVTIGLEMGKYASSIKYDPDKQVFRVFIAGGGNHFRAGRSYGDEFTWNVPFDPFKLQGIKIFDQYREDQQSYTGQNAFGVAKDVRLEPRQMR
jgi:hypothetical protein